MATDNKDPLVGRVLGGKLRLERRLGEGAMGAVYQAYHLALDKAVAIKVLHQTLTADDSLVRRFRAEARAASRLEHPNSIQILDFGEDGEDRLLYIAMEFVAGEDLHALLEREGVLPLGTTVSIMTQVCSALAVAHEKEVIHRDMKPGNIMLVGAADMDGRAYHHVKVCDFGLAKVLDVNAKDASGAPLTKQGMIFGTPTYMSPEQATGAKLDARTDIYSCGVILYRMATGHVPFTAENTTGLLMKHIMEPPPAPAEKNPGIDPRISDIIMRALVKDRDERYQTMREMLAAVRAITKTENAPLPRLPTFSITGPHPSSPLDETSVPISVSDESSAGSSVALSREAGLTVAPGTPSEASIRPPRASMAPMLLGSLVLAAVCGFAVYAVMMKPPTVEAIVADSGNEPGASNAPPIVANRVPDAGPKIAIVPKKPPPRRKKSLPSRPKTKLRKSDKQVPPIKKARPVLQDKLRDGLKEKLKEALPPPPVAPPPPKKAPPPPPPPPPKGPPPLPSNFGVQTKIQNITIMSGGLTKNRTRRALKKHLAGLGRCLRKPIRATTLKRQGRITITGTIKNRNRLSIEDVAPSAARRCANDILNGARVDSPDTGRPRLRIEIAYRVQ